LALKQSERKDAGMDVFDLRSRLVTDYSNYVFSFIKIRDNRIKTFVDTRLNNGLFWPEPLLQLNPVFQSGGTLDDLIEQKILHPECSRIFRIGKSDTDSAGKQLMLHEHQRQAILKAAQGDAYVLTSGTGSGKSLTWIVPIVDHILKTGSGNGIRAIIVYPMNALANSQEEELGKFLKAGYPDGRSPVRFAKYTGQELGKTREELRSDPPDILLTNYMMLELMLTRTGDRELIRKAHGLRFLVFDEMHTYRGRQGADVAMLIRRCRRRLTGENAIICIGTSATMATGGTENDRKRAVADVAETLFDVPFDTEQIIGETLKRATPEINTDDSAVRQAMRKTIESQQDAPDEYHAFRNHPLSSWIESAFGICKENGTDIWIRQSPRRLEGDIIENRQSAAVELAELTGTSPEQCAEILRRFLRRGSQLRDSDAGPYPIFAFRLHQFFTRGDTVWATLEPAENRHLEIRKIATKPGDPDKPLFPLVFCRNCGAAYYRVRIVTRDDGMVLIDNDDLPAHTDSIPGYLRITDDDPWPTEPDAMMRRLPDFMKEQTIQGGERIRPEYRADIPKHVHVLPSGKLATDQSGIPAALIEGNFLFCMASDCGVAYTKTQRSERNKLATLGVDSRSTATTILAMRSLIELQNDRDLKPDARKLLSFTDNRQDASLQAGHFNDFVQVALLRSALYRAVSLKGSRGLRHGELSRCVFEALQLPFETYAADSDLHGPARQSTHNAFRRVLEYYLYRDLQRGWRVTAPNLEDCGLLWFDYDGLSGSDGLLSNTALWRDGFCVRRGRPDEQMVSVPEILRTLSGDLREELLRTLLDVLRRGLAINVDVLNQSRQLDLVESTKPRLCDDTVWYLQDTRDLTHAAAAYPCPRKRGIRDGLFVSPAGAFGRYLKRTLQGTMPRGSAPGGDVTDAVIRFLFLALKYYGIIEQVRGGRNRSESGYQINADALRWLPGDGDIRPVDRTRLLDAGEIPPAVNRYFVECYRGFVDLQTAPEAREHTAQVAQEDRKERETRFRTGELPLLFCSPTMELGVDIAQLNLVNMRNIPPTPANYAQRSGRAGRGGQPALVFTYCAGRSPHDQYFFREPGRMVAGSVAPPRIDLMNRDLIHTHIHALWMEIALPDFGKTLASVVDIALEDTRTMTLPVNESLTRLLRDPALRTAAMRHAETLLCSMTDELNATPWYHDRWIRDVLEQIERRFDTACERWRALYRAAVRQRHLHHTIIGDHSRPENEREQSRRLRSQAETQIRLLSEAAGMFEGDFYSYRYFAAEGFLPGYNFPRLPLSAFVPGRRRSRGKDEYVSRPRFLAISEFGPRALIYHEGARYRVSRVNLDFGSDDMEATHTLVTAIMKRCEHCGYAHHDQAPNFADVCDRCGAALESPSCIDNLVKMQNVTLKPAERITCDEEERQRYGYQLVTAYRFPETGGRQDRKDADVFVDSGGTATLRLSYGDAAELYRINLGWAGSDGHQPPGFNLDLERGTWSRNMNDAADREDAAVQGRCMRVVPYVTDTRNALVLRPLQPMPTGAMAALQAALREAIQQCYQLEPRELAAEPMPSPDTRTDILFYEAAEGGAGVLRQLVTEPDAFPMVARRALEICHFDPDTLEDLAADRCGKACYECLLDYGNQPDHRLLDRTMIRDMLVALARSECRPSGGVGGREERMAALRRRCESLLEKQWLDAVDNGLYRPPTHAQYLIESCSTRPDFFYAERDFRAAIYIDGPPHDEPGRQREDRMMNERLMMEGYIVIRFHHTDDWNRIFAAHPDIFGKGHV
jgi:hypothetical protein